MHLKTVSAAVALALLSTTAMAADLPSRRAPPVYIPPPPIPVFTWTGLYVGAQVGYAFGNSSSVAYNNVTGALVSTGSGSPNGVIGGAHIGYLVSSQSIPGFGSALGGAGVIGIEGDIDGSNYNGTYPLGGLLAGEKENIQGSIRGRAGIAVDRVLFYVTGGAAFGGLTNTYLNPATGGFDSADHTKVGWTAGGGIEYAFTNNWSARVEYRYTDFGSTNDLLANSVGPLASVHRRETDNRVQAGISYKFDTFSPAPVVARY